MPSSRLAGVTRATHTSCHAPTLVARHSLDKKGSHTLNETDLSASRVLVLQPQPAGAQALNPQRVCDIRHRIHPGHLGAPPG
jgi:hypothetical protein